MRPEGKSRTQGSPNEAAIRIELLRLTRANNWQVNFANRTIVSKDTLQMRYHNISCEIRYHYHRYSGFAAFLFGERRAGQPSRRRRTTAAGHVDVFRAKQHRSTTRLRGSLITREPYQRLRNRKNKSLALRREQPKVRVTA